MPSNQLTAEQISFSNKVENLVNSKKISYLEAVLHVCETTGIEYELCKKLMSQNIFEHIEVEAKSLNFLKKDYTMNTSNLSIFC